MLSLIIGLFVLGLVFFFFELIVPGGILGMIGALAMLGGCVLAFVEYGAGGGMLTFMIFSVLAVACLVLELKILPRTRLGGSLFLDDAISGTSQKPAGERELIGLECEALTTLSPTGLVKIEGKQYEAFSQSGLVNRGARLKVVDVDNFRVKVSKL
jgi:membrane-bound ClpP family serine protease